MGYRLRRFLLCHYMVMHYMYLFGIRSLLYRGFFFRSGVGSCEYILRSHFLGLLTLACIHDSAGSVSGGTPYSEYGCAGGKSALERFTFVYC